jgi:Secretion system C-terminal sorting domain
MKTKFYFFITAVVLILAMLDTKAQNSLPDSIIAKETFGSGNNKASLPAGRTTYTYNSSSSLADGDYMLYKRTNGRPEWHDAADHTGNNNGRAMVINAGMSPSEFYKDTVTNLTGSTLYNVTLYVMNTNTLGTCGSSALLPKVQFIVEYYNNTTASYQQLTTFNSGFIPQSANPTWVQIGGTFTNPAGNSTIRYRLLNNSTGGCGNDLAIDDISFARGIANISGGTGGGALPVTGMYVSAQSSNNSVQIQWQTLSEYNSSYFTVEKSSNAVNWVNIDSVAAAGFSTAQKNYSSADYKAAALNYYRIKQVDRDGRYTYSNIVRVHATTGSAKAYPNPFVNQVQVDVVADAAQKAAVIITDMQGRRMLYKNWNLNKGANSLALTEVKQLVAGVYFLEVKATDGSSIFKTSVLKN